jgi:hypothetical protein
VNTTQQNQSTFGQLLETAQVKPSRRCKFKFFHVFFYRNKKTLHHLPLQKIRWFFPMVSIVFTRDQITCPHKMTYWQKAHLGILRLFASYYLRPGGLEDGGPGHLGQLEKVGPRGPTLLEQVE